MKLWVILAFGVTLIQSLTNETQKTTQFPPDLLIHDSTCFNVKTSTCIQENPCDCLQVSKGSVVCCNIPRFKSLQDGLTCLGVKQSDVKHMHIWKASLPNLDFLTDGMWPRLESLSMTEGRFNQLTTNVFHSNLTCLNLSSNFIPDLDAEANWELPSLTTLDLSKNNLTKLPKLMNVNISLDISGNGRFECQTLLQLLKDNPQVNFVNSDSTYCFSSKNFHWFNSTAQVPLSQVLISRNIEQNCTRGCNCRSHRLDMVPGRPATISVLVDCSSLGLEKLPEYLPTNTISLNVSNNNISSLDPLTYDESYEDVREFYADYNQITSILALEGSKFIDNFLVLSLRENNIKSIPTYILSNTFDRNYHNRRVNLGGNRLICNCSVAQVVKVWLLSNKKHIPDYDQVLCDGTGEKVLELDQNKVCVYQKDWTDYIYYIIAGEVFLLVMLVGKVSYDYWVFKTAGYLPWPASKMPKLPCDWVFERHFRQGRAAYMWKACFRHCHPK